MSDKPKYHVVQFSGGKDSTAMLLHMIELNMPIDEIIFCDTTVEFPEMYEHIDKVEKYIGRKITRLEPEHDYEYYLLYYKFYAKRGKHKGELRQGYGFPWCKCRWCTRIFKGQATNNYVKNLKIGKNLVEYIGIAADEKKRIKDKVYPLVEWGWTEADCLNYCYEKGFDWGGLYKIFDRVSCWCCPLQKLSNFRALYNNFPMLWDKLCVWEDIAKKLRGYALTDAYSCLDLATRFELENERLALGLPIGRNREFHTELKKRLKEKDNA